MTVISKQQFLIPSPQSPIKKQLKLKHNNNSNNNSAQNNVQSEFKVNVYNYFLDDFPKTYTLSLNDSIQNLKDKIVKDTQIRFMDIKNFKDEKGKFVNDKHILSRSYTNGSNLNMEIFFNQDLKITINNKRIACFMFDFISDNTTIYEQIIAYHKSEKGGKIIVGVQSSDGLIKGINIPDQDFFKNDFIYKFGKVHGFKNSILKNVDISFFRVKGQNKTTYNFNDHKKIMIIKIKGTNQQDPLANASTDDEDHKEFNEIKEVKQQIQEVENATEVKEETEVLSINKSTIEILDNDYQQNNDDNKSTASTTDSNSDSEEQNLESVKLIVNSEYNPFSYNADLVSNFFNTFLQSCC